METESGNRLGSSSSEQRKAALNETYTKNFLPNSVLKKRSGSNEKRRKSVHFEPRNSADRNHYNVVISCTSDKQFEMKKLEEELKLAGKLFLLFTFESSTQLCFLLRSHITSL